MKKIYDKAKREKLSITIDNELLIIIDELTSNRSYLINSILKDFFKSVDEDVSKIKL